MITTKEIHPAMQRLYMAAVELELIKPEQRQSALAALLNITPQMVNNWESRGPSKSGLLDLQNKTGISATYVDLGKGPISIEPGASKPPIKAVETNYPEQCIEMWRRYCAASPRARRVIDAALTHGAIKDRRDPLHAVVDGILALSDDGDAAPDASGVQKTGTA